MTSDTCTIPATADTAFVGPVAAAPASAHVVAFGTIPADAVLVAPATSDSAAADPAPSPSVPAEAALVAPATSDSPAADPAASTSASAPPAHGVPAADGPALRTPEDVSATPTGAVHVLTGSIRTLTGSIRIPHATAAIRTLGDDPATAPVMLHPGDALTAARRVVYIILLGALTALGPFTVDLYLPAFPVLEHDFQTTAAAVQLTLTGTMIGFGLGQLIVGPLSDRLGRRIPLLIVTALHVAASIASALAPTLLLLGGARVMMGVGAAAGGVVAMAMVRDLFGGKRLVVMLSRLALVSGAAPVIAPLIGSALLSVMDWRGIFYVLAGYGIVMLSCAVFVLPETLPRARRQDRAGSTVWQGYRAVLHDRVFVGVLVIGAMTFSGLFSYLSSSPFLFQQTYGFNAQQYGMLFAANSIGLVIGNQIAARLAARFGPQWVLAFSTAVLVLSAVAIVVCDAAGAGLWGTIIPLFVFMSTCGFTFPCVQVLALDRHGKAAGTAASLLGFANNAVAGLISPLVGVVAASAGITPTTMAVVMIGCSLIGAAALWAVVRPRTVPQLAP